MRRLTKRDQPEELANNRAEWERLVAEEGTDYYKTRYRLPAIKARLVEETAGKCAYCESKIGHNTPGDIEHKVPVSVEEAGRFDWLNLTIACTECNRRKNAYFDRAKPFIDPYAHDVEQILLHEGPCVFAIPGQEIAEISVRILELNAEKRMPLFSQKIAALKSVTNLMERIVRQPEGPLRDLLVEELVAMASPASEYSAMVQSIIQRVRGPWN